MTYRDIQARRRRLADFIVEHQEAYRAHPRYKWVLSQAFNLRQFYRSHDALWAREVDQFLGEHWAEEVSSAEVADTGP